MNSEKIKNKLFIIHDIQVNVEESYLIKQDVAIVVEPKIMMLLSYLLEHAGEVVSRDQLLNNVWTGSIVSDNAVNWSISQLRKLLDDKSSAPRFIKTISKVGYQFIAPVKTIENTKPQNPISLKQTNKSPNTAPVETTQQEIKQTSKKKQTSKQKWLYSISSLVISALALLGIQWPLKDTSVKNHQYTIGHHKFATQLAGLKQGPQLSPDGQHLLFRYQATKNTDITELYLQSTQQNSPTLGMEQPEQINHFEQASILADHSSEQKYDYRDALWSADSRQIYAVRLNQQQQCQIVVLSLTATRDKIIATNVLTTCHQRGHSKLALNAEDQILYFTNRSQSREYQLFNYDLATGKSEHLPIPYQVGFGIRFIDFSSKQQQLLILQDITWSQTQFNRYSPLYNKVETLVLLNSVYHSAFWGPTGEDIWLNWGNDQVNAYHIANQSMQILMQNANKRYNNARPMNEHLAYYIVSDSNQQKSDLKSAKIIYQVD